VHSRESSPQALQRGELLEKLSCGADQLLAAIEAEVRDADHDQRAALLDERPAQDKAERTAAKAAQPRRPLSADQKATRERWARWARISAPTLAEHISRALGG
jgi:hypothetical protein